MLDINNLLSDNLSTSKKNILSTTFHHPYQSLRERISKNWDVLERSPYTSSLYEWKLMGHFRKGHLGRVKGMYHMFYR
jgi:hypothetical protein